MSSSELPKVIPIFPLSNFIIFPKTAVPLNIFEPRYIEMVNDSMKSNKLIGMIQPKKSKDVDNLVPELHDVGCLGKIVSFRETEDKRFLIELRGLIRFEVLTEIHSGKNYRECEVKYNDFENDLLDKNGTVQVELLKDQLSDLDIKYQDLLTISGFTKNNVEELFNSLFNEKI